MTAIKKKRRSCLWIQRFLNTKLVTIALNDVKRISVTFNTGQVYKLD